MELRSKELVVKAIKKKTQAKLFKDVKMGDVLTLEMSLQNTSGASSGSYATYIQVRNRTQGTSISNSQVQLISNLRNFELEER